MPQLAYTRTDQPTLAWSPDGQQLAIFCSEMGMVLGFRELLGWAQLLQLISRCLDQGRSSEQIYLVQSLDAC